MVSTWLCVCVCVCVWMMAGLSSLVQSDWDWVRLHTSDQCAQVKPAVTTHTIREISCMARRRSRPRWRAATDLVTWALKRVDVYSLIDLLFCYTINSSMEIH